MSRDKIRSIIWSIIDVALYPVVFMISIPLFINHMGDVLFGFWMLINAILVTGQLLSMGLGTATYRNVSKFLEQNNREEIWKTIISNILTSMAMSIVCLLICGIILFGIHEFQWFQIEFAYRDLFTRSLLLCVPLLILKFIEQILLNAIKAYERFVLASIMNMISRFGALCMNILLILTGHISIELILLVNLSFLLLIVFAYSIILKILDPGIHFKFIYDLKRVKEEINFGWWIWIQALFVIITYQGDKFLVMSFFGPSKLAYYSIVSTMFNHIHMCFCALAPWVFPKIAKMKQRGEHTPSEFFKIRSYIIVLALISLWLFSITNEFLLTFWLGTEKYSHIKGYISLFILFELFFVYTIVPSIYCNSSGNEKLETKVTMIYTTLNFAGMLAGYYLTGNISGLIWGLVISTVPGMIIQNAILNNNLFHRPMIEEVLIVFIPSFFMAFAILNSGIYFHIIFIAIAVYMLYVIYFKRLLNPHVAGIR